VSDQKWAAVHVYDSKRDAENDRIDAMRFGEDVAVVPWPPLVVVDEAPPGSAPSLPNAEGRILLVGGPADPDLAEPGWTEIRPNELENPAVH
jgi:hypothetical protein